MAVDIRTLKVGDKVYVARNKNGNGFSSLVGQNGVVTEECDNNEWVGVLIEDGGDLAFFQGELELGHY